MGYCKKFLAIETILPGADGPLYRQLSKPYPSLLEIHWG